MEPGLVSVVLPTYNRAHLIGKAIESVLCQTYTCCEVVVVDDGSNDGTEEVIRGQFAGNARIRYFAQKNRGVGAARNVGMREARGEFIAFLDSDDAFVPGKLEMQVACLRFLPDAGMIWTDMEAVDAQGKTLFPAYLRRMYDKTYDYFPQPQDLFQREYRLQQVAPGGVGGFPGDTRLFCGDISSPMVLGNLVHTSTVLLRRQRQEQVGFFDERLRVGEDYPFHLRTTRLGPVAFAEASATRYCIGMDDALTSLRNSFEIARAYVDTLEESLRDHRDRIHLPARMLERCQAAAYEWMGREHVKRGEASQGRANLLKSLRYRPFRPATIQWLLLSLLPYSLRETLRNWRRRLLRRSVG
jgi:GT2 family glycosyltransferase